MTILNGFLLSKMITAAANELDINKDYVDSLNVFPVPDGDTGTNMSLTVLSAAHEIENLNSNDISYVAKVAATGALKGARGNSGVILSQLFRGFAKGLENITVASNEDIALALMKAAQMAYKAVMKPKEGTILTLAREIAEKFSEEILNYDDFEQVLMSTIMYGKKVLNDTIDMLPQLKQAGVVDSGARGLLFLFEGALKSLNSEIVFEIDDDERVLPKQSKLDPIDFNYEVLIDVSKSDEDDLEDFKEFLSEVGDSLAVTNGDEFTRIHAHTNVPDKVVEKALEFWTVFNVRFENLKSQHDEIVKNSEPRKSLGFIAVSSGKGFNELFKNLGADEIVEGTPSIEDFLNAIEKINADKIIILPNNKNVILAAEQVAELVENKEIVVLPTQTFPQGISALLNCVPDSDNIEQIRDAINLVKTGQVTYAVRDSEYDGNKIEQGDILGIIEDDIVLAQKDLDTVTKQLIDLLVEQDGEVLTIYYGKDVDFDAAQSIFDYAKQKYPQLEIEIYDGEQPLYYYIISIE